MQRGAGHAIQAEVTDACVPAHLTHVNGDPPELVLPDKLHRTPQQVSVLKSAPMYDRRHAKPIDFLCCLAKRPGGVLTDSLLLLLGQPCHRYTAARARACGLGGLDNAACIGEQLTLDPLSMPIGIVGAVNDATTKEHLVLNDLSNANGVPVAVNVACTRRHLVFDTFPAIGVSGAVDAAFTPEHLVLLVLFGASRFAGAVDVA